MGNYLGFFPFSFNSHFSPSICSFSGISQLSINCKHKLPGEFHQVKIVFHSSFQDKMFPLLKESKRICMDRAADPPLLGGETHTKITNTHRQKKPTNKQQNTPKCDVNKPSPTSSWVNFKICVLLLLVPQLLVQLLFTGVWKEWVLCLALFKDRR